MVDVDALVVMVFIVQAPRGGSGVCLRGNFQTTTPPRLEWILSANGGRPVLERLHELVCKENTAQLTPAEALELARLVNTTIIDPLLSAPPGFVSGRSFAVSDIPSRLHEIDWYSHCGEPLSINLSMPVVPVRGWPESTAIDSHSAWGNVQFDAQCQLRLWCRDQDPHYHPRWDELIIRFKATVIGPLIEEKWGPYQRQHGIQDEVLKSTTRDIYGALMENGFLTSGHQCFFFLELLLVYEAGHFPCGWDGDWPQGALVVY